MTACEYVISVLICLACVETGIVLVLFLRYTRVCSELETARALLEDCEADSQTQIERLTDLLRLIQPRLDGLEHEAVAYRHQVNQASAEHAYQRELRSHFESPTVRETIEQSIREDYMLWWQYNERIRLSSDPKDQERARRGRDEVEVRIRTALKQHSALVNGHEPDREVLNIKAVFCVE